VQLDTARRDLIQARAAAATARQHEQMLKGELEVARSQLAAVLADASLDDQQPAQSIGPLPTPLGSSIAVPPDFEAAIAAALGEWARAGLQHENGLISSKLAETVSSRLLLVLPPRSHHSQATKIASFSAEISRLLPDIWHCAAPSILEPGSNGRSAVPLGPLAHTVVVRDL